MGINMRIGFAKMFMETNIHVAIGYCIDNQIWLMGKHVHQDGFYPSRTFYFLPTRLMGSNMVKGYTVWLTSPLTLLEDDFWIIPGKENFQIVLNEITVRHLNQTLPWHEQNRINTSHYPAR